jgi:RNA polymerase sigma-70 factor (ECF subfamily)
MVVSDPSVEEALAHVKDGRVDAYEVVVNAYQARLRALLANFCPPGLDADEVAHRAFVEAFKKIDRYAPNTSFFAWVASIGRTLILFDLRSARNEAKKRESYARELVTGTIERELGDSDGLDESRVTRLRECLGKLSANLRTLVDLRYREGASLGAIAERVGKTEGAVKFSLFYARKKLRACVDSGGSMAEEG